VALFAFIFTRTAERYALVNYNAFFNNRSFPYNHACAVVDKHARSDSCRGVNFNARFTLCLLRDIPCQKFPAVAVKKSLPYGAL
jgi:hypothetical protein